MLEKQKPSRWVTLGIAALIVIGGGAAYWLISRRQVSPELPVGAKVIPDDATVTLSVSTDPQQWQQLQAFGTTESQELFEESLAQLRDRWLDANGYNYSEDIQPWIGREVTVAFLPPPTKESGETDTDTEDTEENENDALPPPPDAPRPMLAILPIEDAAQARDALQSSQQWNERTYKDVTIRETEGDGNVTYSAAILDRRLLAIATHSSAIEGAIDTYKGDRSLLATPGYRKAWSALEAKTPFARLFVNVPPALKLAANQSAQPVDTQKLEQLELQGVATIARLEPQGIRFRGVSWLNPNSETTYTADNNSSTMAQRLPTNTVMMVSGSNLKQLWRDYVQGAEANPISPNSLAQWLPQALRSTVNLDLQADLLTWMEGEFSLAMIPSNEDEASNFPGGLVLMVEASKREAAEAAFSQLDNAMQKKYNFTVKPGEVGDRKVVNWTSEFAGLSATHGWLNDDVAFLSVGTPIADRFIPQPSNSLAQSEAFQAIVPSQFETNNGHFFLDLDRTINAEGFSLLRLPPKQKTFVNAIDAIGVTAAIRDKRSTRYDIFVRLKQLDSE